MRYLFLLVAAVIWCVPGYAAPINSSGTTEVFFSPRGGATEAVVHEIDNARKEILVMAYSFTSAPIAKALVQAHKRGVRVEAVLDKSNRKKQPSGRSGYSAATYLINAGIPTYIDDRHAIMHNKVMVIDSSTLITGSFNFTKAAEEKNAENMLVIKGNRALVEKYQQNYQEHKAHSDPYSR
jgi:phosphatidylserine/phosphatidylglycerophosphate/cardiolipin synthase-like enzyme